METHDIGHLQARVLELEQQLQSTKRLLHQAETQHLPNTSGQHARSLPPSEVSNVLSVPVSLSLGLSLHNMLLLSDSALPLGSFAYSSGLESFLAHHKPLPVGVTSFSLFSNFIKLSTQAVAYTNVPYVLAGFRDPLALMKLDNDLDASTPCTVAKRASVAQGRALLSVWEKAFSSNAQNQFSDNSLESVRAINIFATSLKQAAVSSDVLPISGHLAPLWGAACSCLGLSLEESGYLFLLNHAKAVMSASVRASVIGPYMAQNILAGKELQNLIKETLEHVWLIQPEDAGQVIPAMDLWIGRHEMLYSRIFNS